MNILFYCDEYPPVRNGGIGTVVKLVAEAMSRRGHRVIVAGKYWKGKGIKTVEQINGVEVIRWHKRRYSSFALWIYGVIGTKKAKTRKAQMIFSKTQRLIEKAVRHYSIDVVEMPDYMDDFIHCDSLSIRKWSCSAPRIIRVHGSVSFLFHYLKGCPDLRTIRQDQAFFSQADAICAVSQFSKEYVDNNLCPEKDIRVIYNPIDEHWFSQNQYEESSQTILFFGKIAKMKGAFSLVQAFNLIAKDFPGVELKFIGSGNTDRVRKLVDPAFAQRVFFEGFMPQDRIREEIDQALFCVMPSYFENFSMAALEVLARKKTLIYTCRASGRELIEDGVNGLLVDPDDIEQIADKMRCLLYDPGLRKRLAENGFVMCKQRFSTETILPQMESYYREVIERCRR